MVDIIRKHSVREFPVELPLSFVTDVLMCSPIDLIFFMSFILGYIITYADVADKEKYKKLCDEVCDIVSRQQPKLKEFGRESIAFQILLLERDTEMYKNWCKSKLPKTMKFIYGNKKRK
jgi:hypothetical protein